MSDIFPATERLDVPNSVRDINNLFYEKGWTDGLPIIPPTEDAVADMLRYTDYGANDVICELPPRGAPATIELLAINCVMAGCLPEYFPVVLTAVQAAMEDKYNLYGRQTTTNPAGHLVLINGPIRKELDVNCAGQCFGPGWRANATIGRAVRLIFRNIGGAIPQVTDMSTHGMPARYTYCIGEYEEESPWEPLHVEMGYAPETSTVTIFPGQCPVNSFEHVAKTPHRYLGTIASTMAHLGTNGIYRPGENMIVFAPEGAKFIASFGWSKKDVKQALFEYARQKVKDARDRGGWFHATTPKVWIDINDDEATMPVVKSADSIFVVVAGGPAGRHNLVIPTTGDLTECVTRPITFKDGRPIKSVQDFLSKQV